MDITFLGVIASLLALILGLVVYFKGKNNPINLSLATYSLLSSVWCFSLYGYQNALFFSSFVWIKIVYALVFPMISACLYFSFVFPDKKTKKANLASILYWIIGIYFLYILVFTDKFVVKVFKTEWGYQTQLGFMYKYWGLYCSTTAVILINNLFQKYRKSKGYVRFQLKYIFLGLYIMAGGTLTIDVLLPVLTGNTKYFWASSLFSFPFIASTTYAMVKHRFLDIRFVIVKFISYLLLLTVLVTFYIGGNIFAKEILIFYFTLEQKLFISSLLGLVIVFSFLPLKNFLEKIVDQFFYKEKYNSEKLLKEMSQLMSSTLILKELTQKIIQKLINQMKITQVTLILISKNTTSVFSYPSKPVFRKKEKRLFLNSSKPNFILEELKESSLKKTMRQKNIAFCTSLKVEEGKLGVLLLSEKASGDIFSSQDISIFEILVPQMALAIQNSLAYEEIQRFNKTLKQKINRATVKLKKANLRLKELSFLKDEFVSIASHELRTPMTAIKSYLWLALNKHKKELSQKLTKNLNRAYISTERTIRLVKDMLTISRIEGRRLDLNFIKLDLVSLTKQVFDELKIKADEKQIKFSFQKPEFKCLVKADEHKITEVLQNIIGNAIKFTPESGSIQIFFQQKNGTIETNIKDTGPGIPKRSMPNLFKKFGRLGGTFAKLAETPGTGLGLYIAKQIITLHKGKIWIQSKVGEGSTFIFSLPKYND